MASFSFLELAGTRSDIDAKPYTTLMYAVGPGYMHLSQGRENLTSSLTSKSGRVLHNTKKNALTYLRSLASLPDRRLLSSQADRGDGP